MSAGRSDANVTSRSPFRAMARMVPAIERFSGSAGASFLLSPGLRLEIDTGASRERHVNRALRQFLAETPLIELRDEGTLEFVALVQERDPERKTDVLEDVGVLGPGDDGPRRHDRRQVTVDEGIAREIGHPHHLVHGVAP